MIDVHRVNVLGPLMVTQAMLPMIRKGKRKLVSTPLSEMLISLLLPIDLPAGPDASQLMYAHRKHKLRTELSVSCMSPSET